MYALRQNLSSANWLSKRLSKQESPVVTRENVLQPIQLLLQYRPSRYPETKTFM